MSKLWHDQELGASSHHERRRTATQHLSTCRTRPGSCSTRSILCSLGPCRLRLVSLSLPLTIPSISPRHPHEYHRLQKRPNIHWSPPYPPYHPPDLSVPIRASKTAFINCPNRMSLLRCNRGG
ncbi:hypothetical protein BDN67DRAFT_971410 [Paxillus ammoniavirescens]|nr:hypothetical protein BDN67DRAFT_971410 [Paxillus ammoniavirescens]